MVCVLHSMESLRLLWMCAHRSLRWSGAYATAETVNDADALIRTGAFHTQLPHCAHDEQQHVLKRTRRLWLSFDFIAVRIPGNANWNISRSAAGQKLYGMLWVWVCGYQPSTSDVLCLRIEVNSSQWNMRSICGALERWLPWTKVRRRDSNVSRVTRIMLRFTSPAKILEWIRRLCFLCSLLLGEF